MVTAMTNLMINLLLIASAIVTNGFESAEEQAAVSGGVITAYAGNKYTQLRAAEFKDASNTNYLAVKTETEDTMFKVTPNTTLADELYLDTLATFAPCDEPTVSGDKIILWVGTDGYLYVKGGYYEAGLGLGGVSSKTYKTKYEYGVDLDKWVRIVVKMYKPFTSEKLKSYAFKVFVDGDPIALDLGEDEDIVAKLIKTQFTEQATVAALNEYSFGYLIPSLDVGSNASTFGTFAAEGSEASIDDVVVTTNAPNNEVAATARYFVLANEVGLQSYDYTIGSETTTFEAKGLAAVNAIKLDTMDAVDISISNVKYTDGSQYGLNADKNCTIDESVISVPAGKVASATMTISGGAKAYRMTGTVGGVSSFKAEYDSMADAVAELKSATSYSGVIIRLIKSTVAEYAEVSGVTNVVIDLSGRTLKGKEENYTSVLTISDSQNVTIRDTMGVGKIEEDYYDHGDGTDERGGSLEIINSSVKITGGSFTGLVAANNGTYELAGGKYYNNGDDSKFTLVEYLADGYTNEWNEVGYWRVMSTQIAPVTPTSLASPMAATVNALGVDVNQAGLLNSEIVITLGSVTSTTDEEYSIFSSVVTVKSGDTPVILTDLNDKLAGLVKYSTNLVEWKSPETNELDVAEGDELGTYKLSFKLPAGQNYFIRVTDQTTVTE